VPPGTQAPTSNNHAAIAQLLKPGVAVEKGTKAVICVNFSACGKRRFNNLRANFVREIPRKEFFNSHRRLHSLTQGPVHGEGR